MAFNDLREFIAFLESKGDIRHVKAPVNRDFEITEIVDRLARKDGGPALLFEGVTGFNVPFLINIFGTRQRMAWALGVEDLDQLADRVRDLLNVFREPPTGVVDKLRALGSLAQMASYRPRTVGRAPCQEVVRTGDDAVLDWLPIPQCWPGDGGRYITFPLVVSRNPVTGKRNVGTYRMQVYDSRTTGMHWQTHKGGAQHERLGRELGQRSIPVAAVLGADPATLYAGTAPLPPEMDELVFAGFLRREPVEVVPCTTSDLEVPAHAEIVLEGYVDPAEHRTEGPFGDHTGYYSLADEYAVFHITAITHRAKPIYPSIIVGRPPQEDYWLGKATERLFLPIIQMILPEVVDINMPAEGIFHNLVIVSVKKEYPGHARKVMYALWGMGLMMLAKAIVVVDHSVNVHDLSEVAWRVTNNIDARRDFVVVDGPLDDLDHAAPLPKYGSKVGIDATTKGPLEGHTRPWPPDIVMSPEIKALVDRRWKEYGI